MAPKRRKEKDRKRDEWQGERNPDSKEKERNNRQQKRKVLREGKQTSKSSVRKISRPKQMRQEKSKIRRGQENWDLVISRLPLENRKILKSNMPFCLGGLEAPDKLCPSPWLKRGSCPSESSSPQGLTLWESAGPLMASGACHSPGGGSVWLAWLQ